MLLALEGIQNLEPRETRQDVPILNCVVQRGPGRVPVFFFRVPCTTLFFFLQDSGLTSVLSGDFPVHPTPAAWLLFPSSFSTCILLSPVFFSVHSLLRLPNHNAVIASLSLFMCGAWPLESKAILPSRSPPCSWGIWLVDSFQVSKEMNRPQWDSFWLNLDSDRISDLTLLTPALSACPEPIVLRVAS